MTSTIPPNKRSSDWVLTPDGDPRGYIQPQQLKELWFHTGTVCNLACPFCLEGSKPGDDRLNKVSFDDVQPFIDEAMGLGVEQFSFTGGEPFIIKDIVKILAYALERKSCLVLSNATMPLQRRLKEVATLADSSHELNFRVSFDHPDFLKHDQGRGAGMFQLALEGIAALHQLGFGVSIARHRQADEDGAAVDAQYQQHFQHAGIPTDTRIVSFPDFLAPGFMGVVPHITESCMTQYHTSEGRVKFMCHFSKMVVKHQGQMRVYACTLVDDDPDYDLGTSLKEAMRERVMLKHHRCYSCFAQGACCSEL